MFYTYILQSDSTGKLYIGQTKNIEDRLGRHNRRGKSYTNGNGPWKVIFQKEFISRKEAIRLERKLKSYKNKEYILSLLKDSRIEKMIP